MLRSRVSKLAIFSASVLLAASAALADGGVTFTDIADDPASGIDFGRVESTRQVNRDFVIASTPYPLTLFSDFVRENHPLKAHGAPGVALLDYDNDGDLDIYATNGPGAPNSLFQNQFAQTGAVTFVDSALAAGVGATAQDSSGVCFGDIDNDGDQDLYVVSSGDGNLLFENNGNGSFTDITSSAGVAGDGRWATGCTIADVDNNGRVDLIVGNTYDWSTREGYTVISWPGLQHNYLFMNQGGNVFTDESVARGLHDLYNILPSTPGASWTWALTSVDYDQDGDVDLLWADNQGGNPADESEERGYLRLLENDGTGHFTDVTPLRGLNQWGGWMGVDFADFNCDGNLDMFATDIGYASGHASQWWTSDANGNFTPSNAGDLGMTPFGWGTSAFDYDNDGDHDIIFHGGMDSVTIVIADNPGALLVNEGQCSGDFDYDATAILKDHRQRVVNGVAVGDLNNDGFEDIVSVSNFDFDAGNFFFPMVGIVAPPTGGPFDDLAFFQVNFAAFLQPGSFVWTNPPPYHDGTLSVELSSADNGNGWVNVELFGGTGLATGAITNRAGIGAVVSFTPAGGPTSKRPIAAGSSYASQDELSAHFGLGSAATGTVDVLWNGGVKNRLYDVAAGEDVVFPEIPCSFDGNWSSKQAFRQCVREALKTYRHPSVGVVSNPDGFKRFEDSMLRAFDEAQ
jgi:enediyne biosynthesis protein E4